jgi:riboflavin synthase
MFTGLVQAKGTVRDLQREGPGKRLTIAAADIAAAESIGASVAVNGCCLTIVELDGERMTFEAGPETLSRTNLGQLQTGNFVNLERSLRMGDPLGGHLVTGHIDAVGTLETRHDEADWSTMWFQIPARLSPQIASKGSIAVDGVSLTLVDVEPQRFSVQLIPHTLAVTTLGEYRIGEQVNIETDLIAKYVETQLSFLKEQP